MVAAHHVLSSAEAFIRRVGKKNSCEANIYLLRIYLSSIDHFVHFNDEILIESLKETRGGGGELKNDATTIDADDRSKGGRGRGGGGEERGQGEGEGRHTAYEILLTQPAKPDTFKLNIYLLIDGPTRNKS